MLAMSLCVLVDLDVLSSNIMYCYGVWDQASSHVTVQWTTLSPNTPHGKVT